MIERGSPGRKLFGLFLYIPKLRQNCSQVLWYNLNAKIEQQIEVCRIKKIGSFKGEILWDYLVKAKKNEKKNT